MNYDLLIKALSHYKDRILGDRFVITTDTTRDYVELTKMIDFFGNEAKHHADEAPEDRPSDRQTAWVIARLMDFINDGGGSFRKMLEYLGAADYSTVYSAGGMGLSNWIDEAMEKMKGGGEFGERNNFLPKDAKTN